MPDIAAVVHATERSILDTGAPPASVIIQRLRDLGAAQNGHWLGPAPRITKIIRTGNARAWETHASWVYVWPGTAFNVANRAALEQHLLAAVTQVLSVGDSDWTVAIESYSPQINGSTAWWESGTAAQTHTRDQFATMTGRLDADENPTGPTGPETHPTAGRDLAPGADTLGELKTLGYIALGILGLVYVGPVIKVVASWVPSKSSTPKTATRTNPPLMEGSVAADLQQEIAQQLDAKGLGLRYAEENGNLRVKSAVWPPPRRTVGAIIATSDETPLRERLKKTAARYGFRFAVSADGNDLLFRAI